MRDIELTRQAAKIAEHTRALGLRVSAELERIANTRRAIAWSRGCVQRKLHNHQVAAGLRQDGRQRWAVDEIIEWESVGARVRALVRWLGFDPETGDPWDNSWVPKTWLTADLRAADPGIQRRAKRVAREANSEPAERPEPSKKMPKRGEEAADLVMINYRGRGTKRQGDGAMEESDRRRMRVGGLVTGAQ